MTTPFSKISPLYFLFTLFLFSCNDKKPKIFLDFQLLDSKENYWKHSDLLHEQKKLIDGEYAFDCNLVEPIKFKLYHNFKNDQLIELRLSGSTNSLQASTPSQINSFIDCLLNNYRSKYGKEQKVQNEKDAEFWWQDPKDLMIKTLNYDAAVYAWQKDNYDILVKVAVPKGNYFETSKVEIVYAVSEKYLEKQVDNKRKSTPSDL